MKSFLYFTISIACIVLIPIGFCVWLTVVHHSHRCAVDETQSKVETIIRKSFNEENFKNDGKTGEIDVWGHEIVWEINDAKFWVNGINKYDMVYEGELLVRSAGTDGLLYTNDDILAHRKIIKENPK